MHDRDYCSKRAAKEREAAYHRGGEGAEIAGHLALAYASLARRRQAEEQSKQAEEAGPPLLVED